MSKQKARTIDIRFVAVVLSAFTILTIGGALIMALAVSLTRLDYDALLRFMWSTFYGNRSILASKIALAQSIEWLEETVQQEKGIIRARIFQDLLKSRASYLILELFQNAKVQTKRHCVPAFPAA